MPSPLRGDAERILALDVGKTCIVKKPLSNFTRTLKRHACRRGRTTSRSLMR